jgi:elongation factor P hydroxylase
MGLTRHLVRQTAHAFGNLRWLFGSAIGFMWIVFAVNHCISGTLRADRNVFQQRGADRVYTHARLWFGCSVRVANFRPSFLLVFEAPNLAVARLSVRVVAFLFGGRT